MGTAATGGCSSCNYTFDVMHVLTDEGCGSSSDFDWTVSWPYAYGSYSLIAVEYEGGWYPQGWLFNYDSSGTDWYAFGEEDSRGYYYFQLGYYSVQ
jgi:hypothetical protein